MAIFETAVQRPVNGRALAICTAGIIGVGSAVARQAWGAPK